MSDAKPQVTRVYQNHHLDSTRWKDFQPRDGDIIVTTSYKSGTTFTQCILASLILGGIESLAEVEDEISPWIDSRAEPEPLARTYARIEAQTHQRFIKSHLALDGLPYFENVHYLVVARDPRDVFMSFANHYGNYTEFAYQQFNDPDRPGDPLPSFETDIHKLWRNWISRGWFDWESEGYPFWGNLHHTQSYWQFRHLPNLHFMHYADMLEDLPGAIRRIAAWIGHPVSEPEVERVAAEANFASMKQKAVQADEQASDGRQFFAGGNASFINKGTNGRWRQVLTDEDLALYQATRTKVLTPDCAEWLENGGWLGD
jgi:aryl sulfotransferase